jgi:hypothetical protein
VRMIHSSRWPASRSCTPAPVTRTASS